MWKQKWYYSRLYKRERKIFFESLDSRKITYNKKNTLEKYSIFLFRKSEKIVNKITLVNENKDILSNDKIAADKINTKM